MAFKINISCKEGKEKSKTFKLESEAERLIGMKLGDSVKGEDIDKKLEGYELLITGASDKAGFPALQAIEGTGLRRVLLRREKEKHVIGLRKGRKRLSKIKGLRLRKTVRGNTISADIVQINLVVKKQGKKSLSEIFPEQAKEKEEGKKAEEKKEEEVKKEGKEEKPEMEKKAEEKKAEQKPKEKPEEEKVKKEEKAGKPAEK